ncbi:MAG: dephospho-CoA kinase [Gammaproteobacteria bacterium]
MLIVGLTGSIAMGKTETARMFARLGYPVFDADAAVHRLYDTGGAAVTLIESAFPGVVVEGKVDRSRLADRVTGDPETLARLESIVHPLVRREQEAFLESARDAGHAFAVLDIPLLFETGRDKEIDAVVVASAPEDVQKDRVLARPGMTAEKFAAILARQLPDSEKRRRADFVVDTSKGLEPAFEQVRAIAEQLESRGKRDSRNRP